jgi:hypothetical protein
MWLSLQHLNIAITALNVILVLCKKKGPEPWRASRRLMVDDVINECGYNIDMAVNRSSTSAMPGRLTLRKPRGEKYG